jgi:hypothetical protein
MNSFWAISALEQLIANLLPITSDSFPCNKFEDSDCNLMALVCTCSLLSLAHERTESYCRQLEVVKKPAAVLSLSLSLKTWLCVGITEHYFNSI